MADDRDFHLERINMGRATLILYAIKIQKSL
jgi:hypothetical protein